MERNKQTLDMFESVLSSAKPDVYKGYSNDSDVNRSDGEEQDSRNSILQDKSARLKSAYGRITGVNSQTDLRHQFDSYRNSLVILISKTSEIVDMLFQKDKMTSLHAGMIKSTKNPFKRNEMLLDVLKRSQDDTREATLEIFKQTQQNEVLFLFKSSGFSFELPHSKKILQNVVQFRKTLDVPSEFLQLLQTRSVLTSRDTVSLSSETSPERIADTLLQILSGKSEKSFNTFLELLPTTEAENFRFIKNTPGNNNQKIDHKQVVATLLHAKSGRNLLFQLLTDYEKLPKRVRLQVSYKTVNIRCRHAVVSVSFESRIMEDLLQNAKCFIEAANLIDESYTCIKQLENFNLLLQKRLRETENEKSNLKRDRDTLIKRENSLDGKGKSCQELRSASLVKRVGQSRITRYGEDFNSLPNIQTVENTLVNKNTREGLGLFRPEAFENQEYVDKKNCEEADERVSDKSNKNNSQKQPTESDRAVINESEKKVLNNSSFNATHPFPKSVVSPVILRHKRDVRRSISDISARSCKLLDASQVQDANLASANNREDALQSVDSGNINEIAEQCNRITGTVTQNIDQFNMQLGFDQQSQARSSHVFRSQRIAKTTFVEQYRLRNNRSYITENITPIVNKLLDRLQFLNCITVEQRRYIDRLRHDTEKSDELLTILRSGDSTGYFHFIDCLRDSNRERISNILEFGGVAVRVKVFNKSYSNLDSWEKFLVNKLNEIEFFNGPKVKKVLKWQEELKRNDVQLLQSVKMKKSGITLWMWCRSSLGLRYLNTISGSGSLLQMLAKLFKYVLYSGDILSLPKFVEPLVVDIDTDQLEQTTDDPLDGLVKEDVRDLLFCGICRNEFTNPKMLPCQHTFCLECLEHLIKNKKSMKLPCPMCREVCALSSSGATGLKDNIMAKQLLITMKNKEQELAMPRSSKLTKYVTAATNMMTMLKPLDGMTGFSTI